MTIKALGLINKYQTRLKGLFIEKYHIFFPTVSDEKMFYNLHLDEHFGGMEVAQVSQRPDDDGGRFFPPGSTVIKR
jgi:hypothetical protein